MLFWAKELCVTAVVCPVLLLNICHMGPNVDLMLRQGSAVRLSMSLESGSPKFSWTCAIEFIIKTGARWFPFKEHIFQMVWFNHQLENQSQVELALQILLISGLMSPTEGWCGLVLLSKTVKSKAFKEDTLVPNHFIQESGGIFTRIRGLFF